MAENSPSSWDDLIKQLGAEPAPDALERKRPAIETHFEPPAATAPPKPKAGDWMALASDLGIEVPPEPEPASAPRVPVPRPAEPKPVGRSKAAKPRAVEQAEVEVAGPSAAALESTFAEIEPMESMFEEIIEEEIVDVDFSEEDEFDPLDVETRRRREREEKGLSGEAARNAFEALFEAGSFSALPPAAKPEFKRTVEKRRGPDWRDFEEVGAGAASEPDLEPDDEERADADLDDEAGGQAVDDELGRPKRRRRRRRGRGRDREPEGDVSGASEASEDEEAAWPEPVDSEDAGEEDLAERRGGEDESDDAEGEEKRARRRRPRRRRRRGAREGDGDEPAAGSSSRRRDASDEHEAESEHDDEPVADGHGDESDDDGDDDALSHASHKNMPTWSEAIGVIVETNMQARKTSPSRPSSPRGRGRGRGGRRGKS